MFINQLKIIMKNEHYSKEYFNYQRKIGKLEAIVEKFKFKPFVRKNQVVIDFGCGGGYLLNSFKVKKKIGIEINPIAINEAKKNRINVFTDANLVSNNIADLIISNHALEHVDSPLDELKKLKRKLKKNGTIVFVVPHERNREWKPNDINKHIFTWSPLNLGHLFSRAGFNVEKIDYIKYKLPPIYYQELYDILGNFWFDILCIIYGHLNQNLIQVRIVAKKE